MEVNGKILHSMQLFKESIRFEHEKNTEVYKALRKKGASDEEMRGAIEDFQRSLNDYNEIKSDFIEYRQKISLVLKEKKSATCDKTRLRQYISDVRNFERDLSYKYIGKKKRSFRFSRKFISAAAIISAFTLAMSSFGFTKSDKKNITDIPNKTYIEQTVDYNKNPNYTKPINSNVNSLGNNTYYTTPINCNVNSLGNNTYYTTPINSNVNSLGNGTYYTTPINNYTKPMDNKGVYNPTYNSEFLTLNNDRYIKMYYNEGDLGREPSCNDYIYVKQINQEEANKTDSTKSVVKKDKKTQSLSVKNTDGSTTKIGVTKDGKTYSDGQSATTSKEGVTVLSNNDNTATIYQNTNGVLMQRNISLDGTKNNSPAEGQFTSEGEVNLGWWGIEDKVDLQVDGDYVNSEGSTVLVRNNGQTVITVDASTGAISSTTFSMATAKSVLARASYYGQSYAEYTSAKGKYDAGTVFRDSNNNCNNYCNNNYNYSLNLKR